MRELCTKRFVLNALDQIARIVLYIGAMNIRTFVKSVGVSHAAALWGVSERAVYAWLNGDRTPRPEAVEVIVRTSPVTHAGIYNAEPESEAAS